MSDSSQKIYDDVISEIEEVNLSDISLREKYIYLKRILERSCKDITRNESLQFPSLFSRLVFISQKYNLPKSLERSLQNIRVKGTFLLRNEQNIVSNAQYESARKAIKKLIANVFSIHILIDEGAELTEQIDDTIYSKHQNADYLRIQVTGIDRDKEIIAGEVKDFPEVLIYARYNVKGVNDVFNSTIDRLWMGTQLNLLNCRSDDNGYFIPQLFVLEPDYLIDTSAMAECFQNYGKSHLHYFRRKFEQTRNSQYILLGNLANFFLDELVFADDPELLKFEDVFLESFRQKPFEYTSCKDIQKVEDFRAFMVKAKTQFENIKRVVTHDFPANGIDINQCVLEPSFFCEKYGFQGRLDLLQLSGNKSGINKIIELKSGGLPYSKEDKGKIAINHEVQTTIYRLIIQSVFGVDDRKISASILYSAAENQGENLRLAATYHTLEKEIINIRNQIVVTEHDLYIGNSDDVSQLFRKIFNLDNYGRVPDFFKNQIADIEKVIDNIASVEREYFFRYITFLTRELYLQKTGDDYFESANSTASLWNTEYQERRESFDLIPNLEILNIDESGRDMKILFRRKDSSDFINFREGEICILYPHENEMDTILTNQILKGTIAEISAQHISLRFRYKQKNRAYFEKFKLWTVEHDRLDHSYNNMFKSLFSFLQSPTEKRQLLLGLKEPRSNYSHIPTDEANDIAKKQETVLTKAIEAEDYFLIVGPPGTGKTSVFARRLIEHYYTNTDHNLLIIAYTNRAVDELCEAINQAFGCSEYECTNYIRIGTELSCGENYRHRLLQNIAKDVKSREELRSILNRQRIFIGTLAAITSRPEIFEMKNFNISIIDEASQILEPQIIGILPNVGKFIMIGDHKQLSTITLQDKDKSDVNNDQLNIIELYNCNESLFERLFRTCRKKEWENAYDTLVYQGRMHVEIADFPNRYFYDGALKPIESWQEEPLLLTSNSSDIYTGLISSRRIAFIDCNGSLNSINDKVSYKEAETVVELCKAVLQLYEENNKPFDTSKTLGIITPYRNQIALIKHKLYETGISELRNIMVDTVERFQGSQRDIIIMSFCINKPYQLNFFSNLNKEQTVDRKLNVALTRARQQLFLVGNGYLLKQSYFYRLLLDSIYIISI